MGRPDARFPRPVDRTRGHVAGRRPAGRVDAPARHRSLRDRRDDDGGCSRCIAPATAARRSDRGSTKRRSSRSMRRPARRSGSTRIRRGRDSRISASARARTRRRWSSAIACSRPARISSCSRSTSAAGKVLWSHDLIKEFKSPELLIRPVVKVGIRLQPDRVPRHDHLQRRRTGPVGDGVPAVGRRGGVEERRLSHGGRGANSDSDGRAGHRSCFSRGGAIIGLDPVNGAILWSHPHDPGNDLNCGTPLFGPDNVLFVSSAYQAGSRAMRAHARRRRERRSTSSGSRIVCASCF